MRLKYLTNVAAIPIPHIYLSPSINIKVVPPFVISSSYQVNRRLNNNAHMARGTHVETVLHPITMRRPRFCQKRFHIYCLCELLSEV